MIRKALGKIYIALILIFLYAPIAVLIVLSFNKSKSRVIWGGFTLEWYRKLFKSPMIISAFGTTVVLALASALIASIIGLCAALGIYSMRKREVQITMFFTNIPMLNADIVTGIALMLWFVRFLPLGFGSVLLAHITFNIPYVILSIMPKLNSMDNFQYEAALDLGATNWFAFWKILFPDILPGILSGFFMAVTLSMDDFVITYFTKGAGMKTLSTLIYGEIKKGIKPEIYSLSTLLFVLVLILLILINVLPEKTNKKKSGEVK